MAVEADPATVLEWIKCSECRDLQLTALEQLCSEILFADNIDKFMCIYSPSAIFAATTQVFADELAPDFLLEANARTLTYYLELVNLSAIKSMKDSDLRIICTRLDSVDMTSEKSNEVGQQLVKMLELIAKSFPIAVYRAGGLTSVLRFVQLYSETIHSDVLQAGLNLVKKLCNYCEPIDPCLDTWIESLSALLNHRAQNVIDNSLQALAGIVSRFAKTGRDPTPVATGELIDRLSYHLRIAGESKISHNSSSAIDVFDNEASFSSLAAHRSLGERSNGTETGPSNPTLVHALTGLLLNLCCNSAAATQRLLCADNRLASTLANLLLFGHDGIASSVFRLIEVLIYILGEGQAIQCFGRLRARHQSVNFPEIKSKTFPGTSFRVEESRLTMEQKTTSSDLEKESKYRAAVEAIRKQDIGEFERLLADEMPDLKHTDTRGQTLLNWAASFGTPEMVDQLCRHGADVEAGARTSLDYAAEFGRVEVCRTLLRHGANPETRDVGGLRPIDRARNKHNDSNAVAIVKLFEGHSAQSAPPSASGQVKKAVTKVVFEDKEDTCLLGKGSSVADNFITPETLFLFTNELLPVLMALFTKTQSEVVKYQTMLLARRMIGYLSVRDIQALSDRSVDGLRLSFRLANIIYVALAEESDECVLCALQLSQQLACKARSIYLPIFYRIGLVSMIRAVYDVFKYRINLLPEEGADADGENDDYEDAETDEDQPKIQVCLDRMSFTDENQDEDDADDDEEEVYEEAVDNEDGRVVDEAPVQENEEQLTTAEQEEVIETPDPRNTHTSEEVTEQEAAGVEIFSVPVPETVFLSSCEAYYWQEWMILWFGNLLFVFNDFAVVQLEVNCPDSELRGIALIGKESGPVPFEIRQGMDMIERPGIKTDLVRLYQRIQTFYIDRDHQFLFGDKSTPYLDTYAHGQRITEMEKLQRTNSVPWLARQLSEQSSTCIMRSPLRKSNASTSSSLLLVPPPVPFKRQVSSSPGVIHHSTFGNPLIPTSFNSPFQFSARAGSIFLDLISSVDGMIFLRVRSCDEGLSPCGNSEKAPEMLLFPAFSQNGFIRLRKYLEENRVVAPLSKQGQCSESTMEPLFLEEQNPMSESRDTVTDIPLTNEPKDVHATVYQVASKLSLPATFIEGHRWAVNYHSGSLRRDIVRKSSYNGNSANEREMSTMIRSHIRHLAWKLLCRELASVTLPSPIFAIKSPSSSVPPTPNFDGAPFTILTTEVPVVVSADRVQTFRHLADNIFELATLNHSDKSDVAPGLADYTAITSCSESIVRLNDIFKSIAKLLADGEESLTAYELTSSGLASALLLCLSSDKAIDWTSNACQGIGNPDWEIALMQARRLAFCRAFIPSFGGFGISVLVRRLIEALDLTERLPLHLFERIQQASTQLKSRSYHKKEKQRQEDPSDTQEKVQTNAERLMGANTASVLAKLDEASASTARTETAALDADGKLLIAAQSILSALPLGLMVRRCESSYRRTHRRLNGGGVSALTDLRVYNVLSVLMPSPRCDVCSGILDAHTLHIDCPVMLKRDSSAVQCHSQKLGCLRLRNLANYAIVLTPLRYASRMYTRISDLTVMKWDQLQRSDMRYFDIFKEDPCSIVDLIPPCDMSIVSTSEISFKMGVIAWLGTNAGTVDPKHWLSPCRLGLINATLLNISTEDLHAKSINLGSLNDVFVPAMHKSESTDHANGVYIGFSSTAPEELNVTTTSLGPGFAVDLGLQLTPSAYSIGNLGESFPEAGGHAAPLNWCLQASNDCEHWVTLMKHVNDGSLEAGVNMVHTWRLDPKEARPWPEMPADSEIPFATPPNIEKSSCGDKSCTVNIRTPEAPPKLAEGNEKGEITETSEGIPKGWRVFRLMATGANSHGCGGLPIGSFEIFGSVAGVHKELFSSSKLAGAWIRSIDTAVPGTRCKKSTTKSAACAIPTQSSSGGDGAVLPDSPSSLSIRSITSQLWRRLLESDWEASVDGTEGGSGLDVFASHLFASLTSRRGVTVGGDDEDEDEGEGNAFVVASEKTDDETEEYENVLNRRTLASASDATRVPLSDLFELFVCDVVGRGDRRGRRRRHRRLCLPKGLRDLGSRKAISVDLLAAVSASPQSSRGRAATVDIPELQWSLSRRRRHMDAASVTGCPLQTHDSALLQAKFLKADAESERGLSHASEFYSCVTLEDVVFEGDGGAVEFAEAVEALIQDDAENALTGNNAPATPFEAIATAVVGSSIVSRNECMDVDTDENTFAPSQSHHLDRGFGLQPERTVEAASDPDSDELFKSLSDEAATEDEERAEKICDSIVATVTAGESVGRSTETPVSGGFSSAPLCAPLVSKAAVDGAADTVTAASHSAHTLGTAPVAVTAASTTLVVAEPSSTLTRQTVNSGARRGTGSHGDAVNGGATTDIVKEDSPNSYLAPGLIPAFDPSGRNRNVSASSQFQLIPPTDRSGFTEQSITSCNEDAATLMLTLMACYRNRPPVAEVPIHNDAVSIFNYILELAEKVAYATESNQDTVTDGETPVKRSRPLPMYVSYRFQKPEDRKLKNAIPVSLDPFKFLSDRDSRLITHQEAEICKTLLGSKARLSECGLSVADKTEEFLQLIRIIYQMSGVNSANRISVPNLSAYSTSDAHVTFTNPDETDVFFEEIDLKSRNCDLAMAELTPDHFISPGLSRKLIRQLRDPLAVASAALPDWCITLPKRLSVLFPFEVRLNLFRSSAFGAARAVIWLQEHVVPPSEVDSNQNSCTRSRNRSAESSLISRFRHQEATRLADGLATYLVGTSASAGARGTTSCRGYRQRTSASFCSSGAAGCGLTSIETMSLTLDQLTRHGGNCSCSPIQVARLHKEFVRIPREGTQFDDAGTSGATTTFWDWADSVLDQHADRKSELEIQFIGEEGTGIGPTLEFFSLVAGELQLHTAQMWYSDESQFAMNTSSTAIEDALCVPGLSTASDRPGPSTSTAWGNNFVPDPMPKQASAFVKTANGLFPSPYPGDRIAKAVLRRFYILGVTIAKCLQDNRRIDLPLSTPFLKLLSVYGSTRSFMSSRACSGSDLRSRFEQLTSAESALDYIKLPNMAVPDFRTLASVPSRPKNHWLVGLLDFDDFILIDPKRAHFFNQLIRFCQRKQKLEAMFPAYALTYEWFENVAVEVVGCKISDLCLDMEFLPSAQFSVEPVPLLDVYSWETGPNPMGSETSMEETDPVTVYNIEDYIRRTLEYCLDKGIRAQMDAFRAGFERVFQLDWLALFNPFELSQLIIGESAVNWSREDILAYTIPCFGYTVTSQTFLLLASVLIEFNVEQRRAFLRFVTGCSSLPPGGLRNLQPRMRVVRKDAREGPFPSVNTCVHYLKLPEYQTQADLKRYLLAATYETGFYLN